MKVVGGIEGDIVDAAPGHTPRQRPRHGGGRSLMRKERRTQSIEHEEAVKEDGRREADRRESERAEGRHDHADGVDPTRANVKAGPLRGGQS